MTGTHAIAGTVEEDVVAFWDGKSRSTLNTLVQADRAGLPVKILDAEGRPMPLHLAIEAAEEGIMIR
jgi:hypothetical protein